MIAAAVGLVIMGDDRGLRYMYATILALQHRLGLTVCSLFFRGGWGIEQAFDQPHQGRHNQ